MKKKQGFTLIEVILAVIILGGGLSVIFRAIIINARAVELSRQREEIAYVFSLGELSHPLQNITSIEDDVPVDGDTSLVEGYTFSRTVDEKEDPEAGVEDDGLYVVRTTVSWDNGREKEEIIRYIRKANS